MATTRTFRFLAGKRWFSVFLCSAVAFLIVTLLAQFTWVSQGYLTFATFISELPFELQCMVSFLAGLVISVFLTKLYVYNKNRAIIFNPMYPPITISIAFIPLFLAVISLFQNALSQFFNSDFLCRSIVQLAICFAGIAVSNLCAIFCKFYATNKAKKNQIFSQKASDKPMDLATESGLKEWLSDDSPIESNNDLDDNYKIYVKRIKDRIMQKTNASIALCGGFGVGKSSIIKCLVKELESTDFRDRKFIHCNIDCWGVNTSDITQFVLSNIIDKINNEIDMSAFKKLPEHYKEALKNGGESLKLLSIFLDEHTNPTKELESLNGVLASCNLRVLVTLQDLDRNNDATDNLNNLAALLDRLKPLESFSFVIAMEYKPEYSDIIVKVTDYREDVIPSNFTSHLQDSLECFNKRLFDHKFRLLDHPTILTYEELSTKYPLRGHRKLCQSVIQINQLILSYRVLKDVIRRVDFMWKEEGILGEVDLVTLMLIVTLRETNPSLFDLILKNYDGLMGNLNNPENKALGIKSALPSGGSQVDVSNLVDEICKGNSFDKAIIMNLFNIKQPSSSQELLVHMTCTSSREQTIINRSHNVSYLKRILLEQVPTYEVRDQDAIKDLIMAKEGDIDPLIKKLLEQPNYFASYDRFRGIFLNDSADTYKSIFEQAVTPPLEGKGISRDWLYQAFFEALTKENSVGLFTWLLENFLQNDFVMFFAYMNINDSEYNDYNMRKIKSVLQNGEHNEIIPVFVNNLERFTGELFYEMRIILCSHNSSGKEFDCSDLVRVLLNRNSVISLQYATLYFNYKCLTLDTLKTIKNKISYFDKSAFESGLEIINPEFQTVENVLAKLSNIIESRELLLAG